MDRRLTPFSGRVALDSLRGHIDAPAFTAGEPAAVALPLVDLLTRPDGARDRQLPLGAALTVVDRQDGWAFVQATKDGYCGWLPADAVGPAITPTHWIAAPASHAYEAPKVQAPDRFALPMGAHLTVTAIEGTFAATQAGFVPFAHLRPIKDHFDDPAEVALMFLGCAYLWGGNSYAGLDCSGLVQIAFHACGLDCPGDSDLQQAIGATLAEDAPLRRNDLIFWKGHVALMLDGARLIHANGHSMSVAIEDLSTATRRIAAQGGGPVTNRRRP
jgi:cell wall-associated NlpC family hydrolase